MMLYKQFLPCNRNAFLDLQRLASVYTNSILYPLTAFPPWLAFYSAYNGLKDSRVYQLVMEQNFWLSSISKFLSS